MPTPATTPLRLAVIDRIITVLKAMDGPSADYFYTAYEAVKRLKNFDECGGFPTYMVFFNADQGIEAHLDSEYVETLTLSVDCWVDLELGEPQSKLCKCLRDVQKAINDDSKSTTVGSLGQLCATCDIGTTTTDNGNYSQKGFAFFELTVIVRIMGDWGVL